MHVKARGHESAFHCVYCKKMFGTSREWNSHIANNLSPDSRLKKQFIRLDLYYLLLFSRNWFNSGQPIVSIRRSISTSTCSFVCSLQQSIYFMSIDSLPCQYFEQFRCIFVFFCISSWMTFVLPVEVSLLLVISNAVFLCLMHNNDKSMTSIDVNCTVAVFWFVVCLDAIRVVQLLKFTYTAICKCFFL